MTHSYTYKKIDAFTAGKSLGNPAACLYLTPDQKLDEHEMLNIAKQHKGYVSEVIYCKNNTDTPHLTYYSSEQEVDFCGHGTIACMYSLIKDTPALLQQREITIDTNKKGILTVYNRLQEQDAILISAPKPIYIGTSLTNNLIAAMLGITTDALSTSLSVDLIDAGLRTLIVPLAQFETEVSIYPDEQELKAFCLENSIDIILIFTRETADAAHIAHTRVFAPRFGYLEDPATGSGNSAFAYYMLKNGMWDRQDCCIEQGGRDRIYNDIFLSCRGDTVLFGGSATVRVDGSYYVN